MYIIREFHKHRDSFTVKENGYSDQDDALSKAFWISKNVSGVQVLKVHTNIAGITTSSIIKSYGQIPDDLEAWWDAQSVSNDGN